MTQRLPLPPVYCFPTTRLPPNRLLVFVWNWERWLWSLLSTIAHQPSWAPFAWPACALFAFFCKVYGSLGRLIVQEPFKSCSLLWPPKAGFDPFLLPLFLSQGYFIRVWPQTDLGVASCGDRRILWVGTFPWQTGHRFLRRTQGVILPVLLAFCSSCKVFHSHLSLFGQMSDLGVSSHLQVYLWQGSSELSRGV